jgi:hypothetical protein
LASRQTGSGGPRQVTHGEWERFQEQRKRDIERECRKSIRVAERRLSAEQREAPDRKGDRQRVREQVRTSYESSKEENSIRISFSSGKTLEVSRLAQALDNHEVQQE